MKRAIEFHPFANIFPLMDDSGLALLAADIKAYGLRESIMLYEGLILDGRNRYRACEIAGVDCQFKTYNGPDPLSYVVSLNLKRRHLTASQLAFVGLEIEAAEAVLAKKRQGTRNDIVERIPPSETGKARDRAADLLGVNPHYITDAKRISEIDPKLAEQVKGGDKTITEAKREIKKREVAKKVTALPDGKYRVIYADPPWSYNDSREGLGGADGQSVDRSSTAARDHYPTMSMAELQALDVKSLAADDCVLLCWGTFPLLPEQFEVIKAWGFKYKTSFVWDKGRGSFGHYHAAEAELLFVCTKGSCTPDAQEREKQVQRWPRGEHSRKPEEARQMIDRLYQHGPRIELFRRGDTPRGWEVWGAEVILGEAAE